MVMTPPTFTGNPSKGLQQTSVTSPDQQIPVPYPLNPPRVHHKIDLMQKADDMGNYMLDKNASAVEAKKAMRVTVGHAIIDSQLPGHEVLNPAYMARPKNPDIGFGGPK